MSGLTASARRALLVVVIALASVLFSTVAFAQTLTVALYPYVPRIDQFETAIRQAWQQVQPGVPLNFIDDLNVWDGGYDKDPPAQADVYVFDAMYFEQFRANNFLVAMAPNEIQNAADFLSYARDAVIVSGNYYAIPQLGCANILFYNVNDAPVANAGTLSQLKGALNQCTYTSEIPPDRRGLLLDMDGRTTNATLYLDIAHSVNGSYPLPQPASRTLPISPTRRRCSICRASGTSLRRIQTPISAASGTARAMAALSWASPKLCRTLRRPRFPASASR